MAYKADVRLLRPDSYWRMNSAIDGQLPDVEGAVSMVLTGDYEEVSGSAPWDPADGAIGTVPFVSAGFNIGSLQAIGGSTGVKTYSYDAGSNPKWIVVGTCTDNRFSQPTNVKYDGVNLVKRVDEETFIGARHVQLWSLLTNISSGSNLVSVTVNINSAASAFTWSGGDAGTNAATGKSNTSGAGDARCTVNPGSETGRSFFCTVNGHSQTIQANQTEDAVRSTSQRHGFGHEDDSLSGSRLVGWVGNSAHATCALVIGQSEGNQMRADGGDDYDHTATAPFTVGAWVYPFSDSSAGMARIFGKENSTVDGWFAGIDSSNRVTISRGTASAFDVLSAGTLPANTWSHMAVRYDGTDMTVWLNGAIKGTLASSKSLPGNSDNIRIGSVFVANTFQGKMDELAIWTRPLSAKEIWWLWYRNSSEVRTQQRLFRDVTNAGRPTFYFRNDDS